MKKTNTLNPLKFFNDNKDKAYKKAGGEMAAFKKSLTKAQDGLIAGPLDENTSKYLDARYPGKSNNPVLETNLKNDHERLLRTSGLREDFNSGPMYTKKDVETVAPDSAIYKKGGTASKTKKRK